MQLCCYNNIISAVIFVPSCLHWRRFKFLQQGDIFILPFRSFTSYAELWMVYVQLCRLTLDFQRSCTVARKLQSVIYVCGVCDDVFSRSSCILKSAKLDMCNKQAQMLTLSNLKHLEWGNTFDSAQCPLPCMGWCLYPKETLLQQS